MSEGEPGRGHVKHQFDRGSLKSIGALVAADFDIPGVTARIVKPRGGGSRFVEVTVTPEGDDWLKRIADHPFTHAVSLMLEAQEHDRKLEGRNGALAKTEAHKHRTQAAGLRESAKKLLGLEGERLPSINEDRMRFYVTQAVLDLRDHS